MLHLPRVCGRTDVPFKRVLLLLLLLLFLLLLRAIFYGASEFKVAEGMLCDVKSVAAMLR